MSKCKAAITLTVVILIFAACSDANAKHCADALNAGTQSIHSVEAAPAAATASGHELYDATTGSSLEPSTSTCLRLPSVINTRNAASRSPPSRQRLLLKLHSQGFLVPITQPPFIYVKNESDLAQAISGAVGPEITSILLPASMTLTQALPKVIGPLELSSAGSSAFISCYSTGTAFTAMTILSESFSMSGLVWAGCSRVLNVTGACQVTIESCSFVSNNNSANAMVRGVF